VSAAAASAQLQQSTANTTERIILQNRTHLRATEHHLPYGITQVNASHLNPSRTGQYSIYLPHRDGRLSWPPWKQSVANPFLFLGAHKVGGPSK